VPTGQTVTFIVGASGPALSYQWRKGTNNLGNAGRVVGATSATLMIANTQPGDAGSYDVLVSNAAGTVVSGAATLTVQSNFGSWQAARFTGAELLDASISGPNADPDHDGFANLLEYALGLEPKSVSTAGLPGVGVAGSDWTYTYTRPADRTDVIYTVEYSTNLSTWSTSGVAHELVSSSGGIETWRTRYPLASATNCYFRLKVVQN
jgi:hypothetical protein